MSKSTLVHGLLARYDLVPNPHAKFELKRYLEEGIAPGPFLTSLLCNDLMKVFILADKRNVEVLEAWVAWLYNYAPPESYGSEENFYDWISSRSKVRRRKK